MEMSQIRYVLAAAHEANFTRAASQCHVTQPALTKGIKALEEELGAPLFHREGRKVQLSSFGQSMLPHLRQIVEEAEAAATLARNYRLLDKAPLRLGVMTSIGHLRLARFLAEFEKQHHGVELAVSEDAPDKLLDALNQDDLDVVLMTVIGELPAQFAHQPLYEERYVVVFPPEHRLGRLDTLTLADLDGENYVDRLSCEMREMVMSVCTDQGVTLYARFRSEREDWVQAMVLAGIGFAFMPEYSVTLPGLMQRPLAPPVTRTVSTVMMREREPLPAAQALLRATQGFSWPG
ncbi:MAG: LysR family transcriptional regulator [Burkholderiaceae bacterium]